VPGAVERMVWAVARLGFGPGDRLLEIGCGRGIAADLVCDSLGPGSLLGIDRSAVAIAAAERRNAAHVAAGRCAFRKAALADADLSGAPFDAAFAVNVNLFWLKPARELGVLRACLARGAPLHLFYQPPDGRQTGPMIGLLEQNLARGGLAVEDVHSEPRGITALLHIRAQAPR
jgi:SAM-dependent methyltransferase